MASFLRSGRQLLPPTTCRIYSIHDATCCNTDDKCAICYESFESSESSESSQDQQYIIPECGHRFHTNCLMTWYRTHRQCPLCRDTGIHDTSMTELTGNNRLKLIKNICRRKNAPKLLQNIVRQRCDVDKKRKAIEKKIKEATHTKQLIVFAKQQKLIRKLRDQLWKHERTIRNYDIQLSSFKISEIVIIKKIKPLK